MLQISIRSELEDIANLERKGEKSATKLIDQIEASKTRGLQRLLYGIDIRHVGERYAKILANIIEVSTSSQPPVSKSWTPSTRSDLRLPKAFTNGFGTASYRSH